MDPLEDFFEYFGFGTGRGMDEFPTKEDEVDYVKSEFPEDRDYAEASDYLKARDLTMELMENIKNGESNVRPIVIMSPKENRDSMLKHLSDYTYWPDDDPKHPFVIRHINGRNINTVEDANQILDNLFANDGRYGIIIYENLSAVCETHYSWFDEPRKWRDAESRRRQVLDLMIDDWAPEKRIVNGVEKNNRRFLVIFVTSPDDAMVKRLTDTDLGFTNYGDLYDWYIEQK